MKKIFLNSFFCSFLFLSCSCSTIPHSPEKFTLKTIKTERISFITWEKTGIKDNNTLRFYISGNGNPTPKNPIALKLAENDDFQNIVVLTRPCQYNEKMSICSNESIWKENQYHPEIIQEMSELVLFYIKKYKPKHIEFVAIDSATPLAFSLAQKFSNTSKIITIGGILDVDSYAKENNFKNLHSSQTPMNNRLFLSRIPQIHYVNDDDKIATVENAERFVSKLINPKSAVVKIVRNIDHASWDSVNLDY